MTSTWLVIAFAGFLALPHTNGPGWLRWLGRAFAGGIALGLSALAIAAYRLGEDRDWTGDGPAMLVVMMIIPVAALCALAAGSAALYPGRRRPGWAASPWIAVGMIAVGSIGSGLGAYEYQEDLRHAHDAPVVALAFVDEGRRLVSCDTRGTLAFWDVASRTRSDLRTLPQLAGAREVQIAPDGRVAIGLGAYGARFASLDPDLPLEVTLPDVVQAAFSGDDEVALATATEVRLAPRTAPEAPRVTRTFVAPVSALAVQGRPFVALENRALIALGDHGEPDASLANLPFVARRLLVSPGAKWLIALDADEKPAILPARGGAVRQPDAWMRMHAVAFVSDEQLVFTTSPEDPSALSLSLERLETQPFFNHGLAITALAALPGVPDAAIALEGDLHLVPAPVAGLHAYASASRRLVNPHW